MTIKLLFTRIKAKDPPIVVVYMRSISGKMTNYVRKAMKNVITRAYNLMAIIFNLMAKVRNS